jgi:3',5'-cyclic AMP phosphodiesterase CpdA
VARGWWPPISYGERVASARVIVVSDSHLSERTPEASAHWDAVVQHLAAAEPDLVVHAGDISADGADRAADLAFARRRLDQVTAPLALVPGNHDIGDTPVAAAGHGPSVDAERLARFRDEVGADRFAVGLGPWRVVGLDAQLLAAGSDDEAEQWDWLERELATGSAAPLVLVLHKPLVPVPGDTDRPARYIPPPARDRLLALLGTVDVRLVVSGHVHQALRHHEAGLDQVWVPSTWAVLPDSLQPTVGDKVAGLVELVLHDDGRLDVATLVPAGVRRLVVGVDIEDPYGLVAADRLKAHPLAAEPLAADGG